MIAKRGMRDARRRMGVERRHRRLHEARIGDVVVAELEDVLRLGAEQRAREVADDPRVALVGDQPQPRVVELLHHARHRVAGRRVVVHLDDEVGERLPERARDRVREPARAAYTWGCRP